LLFSETRVTDVGNHHCIGLPPISSPSAYTSVYFTLTLTTPPSVLGASITPLSISLAFS
jgi:hypothetical protein